MEENLGVVRVSLQQLVADRDRFAILLQALVGAFKIQTDESPHLIVRRMAKSRFEDGQRRTVQAQLGVT